MKTMASVPVSIFSCYHYRPILTYYVAIEEKPDEERQTNDNLSTGSIIGIIIACTVTALLILILLIAAFLVVFCDRKKKVKTKSTKPNLSDR